MTKKEIDRTKAAFFAVIRADPKNDMNRLVFADWCEEYADDENGLTELCGMLRGGSEKWLTEYGERFKDAWTDEEDGDDYQDGRVLSVAELIEIASEYLDTGEDHGLGFQTPDHVYTDRQEFWKHFEVMTGRKPPEGQSKDTFFQCAC